MVDTEGYQRIEASAQLTKEAVESELWDEATRLWSRTERVIMQATGNIDFYNILYEMSWNNLKASSSVFKPILPAARLSMAASDAILDNLMNNNVKTALNIPQNVTWGSQSDTVFKVLAADFMKPVTDKGKRVKILIKKKHFA